MSELKTSGSDSSKHKTKVMHTTQSHTSSSSDIVDLTSDDSRDDSNNVISDSDDSKSVISDSDDDTRIVSTSTQGMHTGNKTLGMRLGFGTSFVQKQSFSKPCSPNPSVLLDKSKKLNIKTLGVPLTRPQPNILKSSQGGGMHIHSIKENLAPRHSGDLSNSKSLQDGIKKQSLPLTRPVSIVGVPITSKSSQGDLTKHIPSRPSGLSPNVAKAPHNNAVKHYVPASRPSTAQNSILKYTTHPLRTSGGGVPFVPKAIHGYGHSNTLVPLGQPIAPKPTHNSIHIPLGKPMVVLQAEADRGSGDNSPLREKARLAENILSLKEKIRHVHVSYFHYNM